MFNIIYNNVVQYLCSIQKYKEIDREKTYSEFDLTNNFLSETVDAQIWNIEGLLCINLSLLQVMVVAELI